MIEIRETIILESNAQIGEHAIHHSRKIIDISNASRFEITSSGDETIESSVKKLPWLLQTTSFNKKTIFYIDGIKHIDKLSGKWGITYEGLIERLTYDEITIPEFKMFTCFVIEELSGFLDLPISHVVFSKDITTSSFAHLTREIDLEVDLLNTIPQMFPPHFSSSQ